MHRKPFFTPLAITSGVLSIILVVSVAVDPSSAQNKTTSPEQLPEPVVGTHELMELFNQPLYKQLKKAMKTTPDSDQQWKTLAERGWQTAEVANLVALRDAKHPAETWKSLSYDLRLRGVDLAEAAKAKDVDKTKQAYASLIESCNTCHNQFGGDHAPQLKP